MSSSIHPLTRLWKIVRAERQEVRAILTFAIFQGLVSLSLPLGIQAIINFLQAGRLSTSWYVLTAFVLSGILLTGYLQLKQMAVSETIEQRLFANTTFEFSMRIPRFSMWSTEGKYIPELMNRFFEVSTVQKGLSKLLVDFSAAVVQIIFGLGLLSAYHISFLMMALLLIVILYIIFRLTGPRGLSTSMEESKYKFAVAHWLEEISRALATFKLAGRSSLPIDRSNELTNGYLKARLQHFLILMTQYRAMIFFKFVVTAALIIIGSVLVVNQKINIGQFVAAEIVVLLVIGSVEKIILSMSTVYDVLTALDKLGSITDIPLERETGEKLETQAGAEGLEVSVKNLTFKFPGMIAPVIKNISIEIKAGETVCITGPNGSGKTTLLRLLSGFYENFDGVIAYNQLPIGNLHLGSLRAVVGENFTEQNVFKGTLLDNINCGLPGLELEDAMRAARQARLDQFITGLPEGYNTMLDPEGHRLPGSVVKKIILARCFVNHPRLLLIEDNFGALTVDERKKFLDTILEECKNITTIIITTDDSLIKRCDHVFTLDKGEVITSNI